MKEPRFPLPFFAFSCLLVLMSACSAAPIAPTVAAVTAVAVPPMASPTPPQANPPASAAVASDTPTQAATQTPVTSDPAVIIKDALAKSNTAESFQFDIQVMSKHPLSPGEFSETGERMGLDLHLSRTDKAAQPRELVITGDKAYVHGPWPAWGAPDAKWYILPAETNTREMPSYPIRVMQALTSDLTGAAPAGSGQMDGQPCQIYAPDKWGAFNSWHTYFWGIPSRPSEGTSDLEYVGLELAETKLFVCDGYLRQIQMHMTWGDKDQFGSPNEFQARVQLNRLNEKMTIAAPQGAVPVPTLTPTPTETAMPTRTPTRAPATVTAAAGAGQTGLSAAKKWPVVLLDRFDSDANRWPSVPSLWGKSIIGEGKYRWEISRNFGSPIWQMPDAIAPLGDMYVSVEVTSVEVPSNSTYGLMFQAGEELYYFCIKGESDFRAWRAGPDKMWDALGPSTRTAATRPGKANHLALLRRGASVTFFVNDQYVGQADAVATGKAKPGILMQSVYKSPAVFEFDNFEVRAP